MGEEHTARITTVTLTSTANVLREAAASRASNPLRDAIVDALEGLDVGDGYVPHRLSTHQIETLIVPDALTAIAAALDA